MGLSLWRLAWQAVVWPVGLCVHHALTGVAVRKSCNEHLQRDCMWTWVNARVGLPGQAPCLLLSHSYFPKMSRPLRWSECDLSIWLPVLPFHLTPGAPLPSDSWCSHSISLPALSFQLAPGAPLPSDSQ